MIIHGINTSNQIKPLLLDANGKVLVSEYYPTSSGNPLSVDGNDDLYIVSRSPSFLLPSSELASVNNTNLSAGNNTVVIGTVGTGEVWQLDMVSVRYVGTVTGVTIRVEIGRGSDVIVIRHYTALTSGIFNADSYNAIVEDGDIIRVFVTGATAGDDCFASYLARRIK